jgi:hypothetical protein
MAFESPAALARLRLLHQQIAPEAATARTPGELVAALGAMQAQDYLGALWAVGLRMPVSAGTPETTEADVEQAIADRTIVRTWPLRGTLHFVAAADVRWMLELVAPGNVAGMARRHQQLELDDATFRRSRKIFEKALAGGRSLPRDALYAFLEDAGISATGQRGYHILWRLAQERVLCFGARDGKQPTFALLDDWVASAPRLERDEALAELARRYFTRHGPATVQDFVWWSGLKVSEAKAGLAAVSAQLRAETLYGNDYWMSPESPESPEESLAGAFLLPGFDEYLLGYRDRRAVLDPRHAGRIVPGGNGMFLPTLVLDGKVVGTWKRTLQKKAVVIDSSPFTSLKKEKGRAFAAAAERYGRFVGLPVQMEI